jgi:hypothetical protein
VFPMLVRIILIRNLITYSPGIFFGSTLRGISRLSVWRVVRCSRPDAAITGIYIPQDAILWDMGAG